MADIVNRESKKRELRKRVVDPASVPKKERQDRGSDRRKAARIRIFAFAGIAFLVLAIVGLVYLMQRQYRSYSVNWTQEFVSESGAAEAGYADYEPYAGGMLKVTRDGTSFINASGKTVWNQSYEMQTPIVSVNGNFCAVADQGQNQIFIMNDAGISGQAQTTLPIVKISVSARGVVYALLQDATASYITVFTKEGVALDISIKSVLSGDGYPVDLSVSPDGTECIVSFVYLENGTVQNKVVFYNLDEVGKNAGSNRVVGGFIDDFAGHMVGRVHFSDDTYAQAFYDGGIAFFSTKVLTSPELISNVVIEETIRSIAYSDKYVAAVTENTTTEEPYKLMVFRASGQKVFEKPFAYQYRDLVLADDLVLLSNEDSLQVYNMSGRLKFDGTIALPVVKAGAGSGVGTNIIIGSTGSMQSIKLQ